MIRRHGVALAAAAGTVLLAGCAGFEHGKGFDSVSTDLRARTGAQARWDRGTDEDRRAHAAVAELLSGEKELTVEQAVQVALLNNREVQAVYEDLDIAQADLVRAGLLRNPVFSGEVRFSTDGGGTGVVLDLTGEFLSLLTMPLRKGRAEAEFEAARARVAGRVVDIAADTAAAFYAAQAAQETANLRAHVEQAAAASYELAQRVHRAGNAAEVELLNEQALYEQARLASSSAKAEAVKLRERLGVLMGAWGTQTGWRIGSRLADLPSAGTDLAPSDIEKRAVASSLELAQARAEVDAAAASAGLAGASIWTENAELGAAAEREVEGGWSVGPSFSIPIPIFDVGAAGRGETSARLRQAADRYYAAAVRARSAAREQAATLVAARERAERYHSVVLPLHQRIVEQAQLQYNAMQISGFQLLQAKKDQIEAGAASVEALRDYWTARAALLRTLGVPFAASTSATASGEDSPAPPHDQHEHKHGGHQ